MPDLLSEPRISLNALAHREGVHRQTVVRWCDRGCNGHVLESFCLGGRRYSTQPAFVRWHAARNSTKLPATTAPTQRLLGFEATERELDDLLNGLGG